MFKIFVRYKVYLRTNFYSSFYTKKPTNDTFAISFYFPFQNMLNETLHSRITENALNKDTANNERHKTGLPIIYWNNTIPNIANEKFC